MVTETRGFLIYSDMAKFKAGQTIEAIERGMGFEKAAIYHVDDRFYYCKIMCGKAKIPIIAENNYKVSESG